MGSALHLILAVTTLSDYVWLGEIFYKGSNHHCWCPSAYGMCGADGCGIEFQLRWLSGNLLLSPLGVYG